MTFLVEVGFSSGAGVPAQYLRLDDPVSGLLDVGLLAPDGLMTDLSTDASGFSRVMEFTVDRGSTQGAGNLVEYAVGTLSLTLRDDDGDLDPTSIAEAIPGVRIRLSKIWAGTVYSVFAGTIDSWVPEHRWPDQQVVAITASDALAGIAGYDRGDSAPAGAGESSGARINRVLDSVGWPAGQRAVDTGYTTVTATTLSGDALEEARHTARTEVGEVWADAAGLIRFRDRYGLYIGSRSTTVQATFGSGGSELPFVGTLGVSYDRSELINVVRAARDGGTVYEIGDEVSRNRYRDRAHQQTDLLFATDAEVTSWAQFVLARDATPKLRFTDLTVDVRADEAGLYPQVLAREFGDRIAVVRRPPGVSADTREFYVRGIRHQFTAPNVWRASWGLEPAAANPAFVLDDAVRGLLDSGNVLAF